MQTAPHSLVRRRRATALALAAIVMVGSTACKGEGDGSVTISGDVEGLDTLALRGDSLFAQADRAPQTIDSLQAVASGKMTRRPDDIRKEKDVSAADSAAKTVNLPGVNAMTARARARGDSMAKAAAMRLTGGGPGGRARGDTIRGVVTLLGVAPAQQVVLRTNNGETTVSLSGMATSGLARYAGMELMVRGVMVTPRDVVVSDYVIRTVDGVPAWDGKLAGGNTLLMSDGSGRQRVPAMPAALRESEGTRVWIAVKPGTSAVYRYGIMGRR